MFRHMQGPIPTPPKVSYEQRKRWFVEEFMNRRAESASYDHKHYKAEIETAGKIFDAIYGEPD